MSASLEELVALLALERIDEDLFRGQSEDLALMLEWFDKVGYNADIEGVQKKYGLKFSRLADWARKNAKR